MRNVGVIYHQSLCGPLSVFCSQHLTLSFAKDTEKATGSARLGDTQPYTLVLLFHLCQILF